MKAETPTQSIDEAWQRGLLVKIVALAVRIALLAGAYCVLAGLVWALESAGVRWFGRSGLGILGLAIDIGLLFGFLLLLRTIAHGASRSGTPIVDRDLGFARRLSGELRDNARHSAATLTSALGPFLALLIVVLFFAVADWWFKGLQGSFWSLQNLRTVAVQSSTIAVAALGMTVIIIAGGIDLSAGTALALCATVLAYCLKSTFDPELVALGENNAMMWVAIMACVLTGIFAGLINGSLISALRVVPFIITLGTMTAFLGVAKIIAMETTVRPHPDAVPEWVGAMVKTVPNPEWIAWPLLPNFAWGVWLALILAAALAFVLHYSVFGRHVFALGSNESTARLCGVNIWRTKVLVYALAGAFVGVAGIYQFARLSSGNPTSGLGMELKVIAAVVIGGGSLNGGRGSVVGTLCGATIMLVVETGCTSLGLQNSIQDVLRGAIIVAAVAIDQIRQGRFRRGA